MRCDRDEDMQPSERINALSRGITDKMRCGTKKRGTKHTARRLCGTRFKNSIVDSMLPKGDNAL